MVFRNEYEKNLYKYHKMSSNRWIIHENWWGLVEWKVCLECFKNRACERRLFDSNSRKYSVFRQEELISVLWVFKRLFWIIYLDRFFSRFLFSTWRHFLQFNLLKESILHAQDELCLGQDHKYEKDDFLRREYNRRGKLIYYAFL